MDIQKGRGNEWWVVPKLMFQGSWDPKAIMEKYLGPLSVMNKTSLSASEVGSCEGKFIQPEWSVLNKQYLPNNMAVSHTPSPCWFFPCSTEDDEEEEEIVHMGNAIMSFYSALIDLLGRCAPEMHVSDTIYSQQLWGAWVKNTREFLNVVSSSVPGIG